MVGDYLKNNEEDNDLGVTLQLPAETVNRLKTYQPPHLASSAVEKQAKLEFLTPRNNNHHKKSSSSRTTTIAEVIANEPNIPEDFGSEEDESENDDDGFVNVKGFDPDDNWNEVLAVPLKETEEAALDDDKQEEEKPENNSEEEEEANSDDDDDEISLSPPPHLPVVVVDIEKIVGYRPSTKDEVSQLEHQIRGALWHGSAEAAEAKSSGNPQEDNNSNMEQILDAAQHFEDRVTELLESGVAQHATTKDMEDRSSNTAAKDHDEVVVDGTVVVSYPEFLCSPTDPTDTSFAPRTVLATSQIWKQLLRSHPIPVVDSLLTHLQKCNRSLVWKHAMHQELWTLAKDEEKARIRRQQQRALREWKYGKRKQQLTHLYQVRETLEIRYGMAQDKVKELEDARDKAVSQEIRRRRMESGIGGGLEAFDLNSTILAFPTDETWLGLADEEDEEQYEDQVGPSLVSDSDDGEGSEYSGYDAEGDDISLDGGVARENDLPTPSQAAEAVEVQGHPRRDTKQRREAAAKKRRKRLEEAAKEAEHQTKLDQARDEEDRMRDMFTTNDLKMAQAIAASLERKMASIDELLESLQEEEWADEEAEEEGKTLIPGEDTDAAGAKDADFSLLDQVLAMVLGSLPPPASAKGEEALAEHTRSLEAEHLRIVKDWKEHFGRVPPSLQTGKTQQEMLEDHQAELKTEYGIVDNEDDDWENADSEDEVDNTGGSPLAALSEGQQEPEPLASVASVPAPAPRPQTVGLRPGGRVQK